MKKEIIILENGVTEHDVLNTLICIHETLLQKNREDECKAIRVILNAMGVDRLNKSATGIIFSFLDMEAFTNRHEYETKINFHGFIEETKAEGREGFVKSS